MKWEDFKRWFNHSFWKAFKNRTFPIEIPQTAAEETAKVRAVFESVKSSRYAPSIPEGEIVMNKGYGVARTVPVFCIDDYIVYYFCVKELEEIISGDRTNNTFGGWSLGGELRKQEGRDVETDIGFYGARYAFYPGAWTAAFGEFNSLLFAQLETGNYTHVLQFDLSNFYDCVRLDILERWIREAAPPEKGWIVALLFYFLNQWNRRNTGLHPQGVGIPQDALADCSRLLANYYLQRHDKFAAELCEQANASYFRYADDQMILVDDKEAIDALMLLLTRNLDRYGLRVNQMKVKVWTVKELQEYRCRDIQAIFRKPEDRKDPKLVRQFVDAYLKLSDADLAKTWNGGSPLLNRLLWANIESLPSKLSNKLVTRFTQPDYFLNLEKKRLVRVHELNQKKKKPIDISRHMRKLGEKTMHNAFHHECLGFAREIKNEAMIKYFSKRLLEIKKQMDENRIFPN